ncbi:phage antirepressor [Microbacterium aurantiacum]|uniref:Phage antirepressor n=1 Tax=Microbacterium aurantiacum TaxID=162393 RepID=A0ABT8FRI3_9MICO|nr:phage antirepressor [Microbacterium aurantiacum]MDN4463928.1 phage antirepressor [Microbacterium aurantiacum]
MSALAVFEFDGREVRTVTIDGEPWFVLADLCRVLGLSNASTYAARLAAIGEVTRMYPITDAMGRQQQSTIVNEPGMYEVVIRSDKPEAIAFRRWISTDVLPSIRRTGSYAVPETPEQLMARALIQAQEIVARRDEQIAVLTPRAEAWDELASAEGDYSVADAAKILARAGVETGPQRLFEQLASLRWIFRGRDGKWRAYADSVAAGYLAERPQSHHHPRTGELVIDPPQVRVTLRGTERLRVRLGVLSAVEEVSA